MTAATRRQHGAAGRARVRHVHDNRVPFEQIGDVGGKEVLPGPLAAILSVWEPA